MSDEKEEKKQELKKLVARLAHVINHTLSNASEVREAVKAINKNGYGIDLSLAACIGVSKTEDDSTSEETCHEEIKFEFDQEDIEFLKSLNLRVTED